MIKIGDNGEFVITGNQTLNGEEWLMRVRSIIHLVQSVDEEMMSREDIYNALAVVEDMLPDEESAIQMFKAIGR